MLYSIQFLHQITTNGHAGLGDRGLYSIQFLHQITTEKHVTYIDAELYSIQFLHQITTALLYSGGASGCIVSNFYIKSQPILARFENASSCIVSNFYIKSQLKSGFKRGCRAADWVGQDRSCPELDEMKEVRKPNRRVQTERQKAKKRHGTPCRKTF